MRTFVLLVGAGTLLGLGNELSADDDAVRAVIAKAIASHGGAKNLAKLMSCEILSEGSVDLQPALGASYSFKQEVTRKPGKYRVWTRVFSTRLGRTNPHGSMRIVFNGEEGQILKDHQKRTLNDKELKELQAIAHEWQVRLLVPLLQDRKYELSVVDDEATVGRKPAVEIKVRREGEQPVNLYFEKDSGRLVKSRRAFYDFGTRREAEWAAVFSNFKAVAGAVVPHRIVVLHNDKKFLDERIIRFKFLKNISDKEFDVERLPRREALSAKKRRQPTGPAPGFSWFAVCSAGPAAESGCYPAPPHLLRFAQHRRVAGPFPGTAAASCRTDRAGTPARTPPSPVP
jgi:hypothetical protein